MTTLYTARRNCEAAQAAYNKAVRLCQTRAQRDAWERLKAAKHALMAAELRAR